MSLYSELIGKFVEIHVGDEHDVIYYADSQKSRKSIIKGKFIEFSPEEDLIKLIATVYGEDVAVYIPTYSVASILVPTKNVGTHDIYTDDETLRKERTKKILEQPKDFRS